MTEMAAAIYRRAKQHLVDGGRSFASALRLVRRRVTTLRLNGRSVTKINLCCGSQKVPGFFGIDFVRGADLSLDLAKNDLPFRDGSLDAVVCISAINYFTRSRAQELVAETHRVLKSGGVARFGVQDLELIAKRYVEKDREFFFQKLPDGRERFEGPTLGDKFAAWFYGYAIKGIPCRYFYDYESLSHLFRTAGFTVVEKRGFRDSRLDLIDQIDNRPDQMFFLEAVK